MTEGGFDALIATARKRMREGRTSEALGILQEALRLQPGSAAAHYLRGEALFLARRMTAALASHAAALRHGIDDDPDGRGRAMSGMVPGDFGWMSHMLRGDFESAWRLADAERERRIAAGISGREWPRHLRPVWDGTPLEGRRVLVRCYHGLGDTLQMIRFVPPLTHLTEAVTVELQPELIPLLASAIGSARVAPLGAVDVAPASYGCDVEADITELPHAFRVRLATVPCSAPYLSAGRPTGRVLGERRLPAERRKKVGLAWAAGAWKPDRSIPLERLAPLFDNRDFAFFSLQRGPAAADWAEWRDHPSVIGALASDDIVETAAIIGRLDLVITVDTMVAHLAGALGAQVWLLLHFAADWRWLLDREDSPWYPTIRLFRQSRPGDWDGTAAAVGTALEQAAR